MIIKDVYEKVNEFQGKNEGKMPENLYLGIDNYDRLINNVDVVKQDHKLGTDELGVLRFDGMQIFQMTVKDHVSVS